MSITYVIPGATPLDQLHDATSDGQADENARFNCVPTSIAEGLHILTDGVINGDELKDAVYGQGYTGVQMAALYVPYCAAHGVTLTAHDDSQAGLIATIHAQVATGHPVVLTMPSQWGTAPSDPVHPSGYTHVGCAVGVGDGAIRVMNPWGGFWQDESDVWWQARLCYGQVWVMQRAAHVAKVGTGMNEIPAAWSDDGATLRAPNGQVCVHGMRAYLLAHAWPADNQPLEAERSVGQLAWSASLGGGVRQLFERGALIWTAAGGVRPLDLGPELLSAEQALTETHAALALAQAALAAEKAKSAPAPVIQPSTPPASSRPAQASVSASVSASGVAPAGPVAVSSPSPQGATIIMNIFQKAWQNANLTPQERALLRLVEGWLWAGLLAALGVAVTLITSGHLSVNQQTLTLILGAGFAAIMSAVKKYVSAHGDLLNSLGGGQS